MKTPPTEAEGAVWAARYSEVNPRGAR